MPLMSGIYTALSGMNAASLRAEVAARNIVNANSAGASPEGGALASETLAGIQAYQPQQVVQSSTPGGGTTAKSIPVKPSTYPVYDPSNPAADQHGMLQYPNVSPEVEMVQMTVAVNSYKANAKVLKTLDETMGALLDSKS
ncbi:MAG TPA: flagellar basal body rod C-terminal domain-containing protein [Alphaproteobacteria bacterium]|nr:flagellar basal body rod C-terminal domain-containing protein [Alphaproteobacteria bacterium]